MIADRDKLTVQIIPGKHDDIHLKKWFEREGRAPMAISVGDHPLLACLAGLDVPTGISENGYAGPVLGEPVPGMPIPARAEIVLEGYVAPDLTAQEGPYGEWTGYSSPAMAR